VDVVGYKKCNCQKTRFNFVGSFFFSQTFYFEDGMDNLFDEHGERVYDPMEGVLTEIADPNIVLETITSRKSYLANKPAEKNIVV
jgi:hypothetical protein